MISRDLHGRRAGRAGMDGGSGSSRHIHEPEGLLRIELEQALAAERGQRGDADRRAVESEERIRLLETERERLLGGLVERARLAGAPDSSGAPGPEEGQADLAGFIAELRAEIETLRAFRAAAVAAGFAGGAATGATDRKLAEPVASVAELAGRFDAQGRVGVSAGDGARLTDLLGTRADRALYERSMDDLSAPDAGKRLRAVRALEALGSRASARRASTRRITERLARMDGEELRSAVLRSASTARATAERVIAATTPASIRTAFAGSPSAGSPSPPARAGGERRGEGAVPARTASARVAVLEAPQPGSQDLEPRVVAELRAALRGCTEATLASVLGAPPARVEATLAALAARGGVEKRGTRWFTS